MNSRGKKDRHEHAKSKLEEAEEQARYPEENSKC